jgi:hypothetical protein
MAIRLRLHAATAVLLTVLSGSVLIAGFSGTDLFLPMVGRQAGVFPSNWYTTVWIHNPGAVAATARVYLLVRGTVNPTPPWVDVLVPPGDTEKLENIVESVFGKQVFGALRVTCDTQKLVVTSRVYSKGAGAGEKDSAGQDFAGVPASFAIGAGEKSQVLGVYQTQPAADSDYRFNFGMVETTGHTANVRVTAYDDNNASQGSTDVSVRAYSQGQWAFKDRFPSVSTENVRLEVQVISGTGKVIAYGSGITNGSQDPTTFEMSYQDALLAANAPAGIGGTGAAGQVAFFSDATTLAGSSSLFWDSGSGRLGIGTSAPAQQLHLTGNLRLPATVAGGAAGVLFVQGTRFLHSYGPGSSAGNTFVGLASGNFTMGGPGPNDGGGNTATGASSLASNTTGYYNTASGTSSLTANTTGAENTASGYSSLLLNTTGSQNTASGSASLYLNTTGSSNTASGFHSLFSNTSGSENTATGASSLGANSTGHDNTASGVYSLSSNTTGSFNTAIGASSLVANTIGHDNTASGVYSLSSNTTGAENTAGGSLSLTSNTTGFDNTAYGFGSLSSNGTGSYNTATGVSSLGSNTTGSYNTATGVSSLGSNTTGSNNTASGTASLGGNTTGIGNTANGDGSLEDNTTGDSNTATGAQSLLHNTAGTGNTAAGLQSLQSNTSGGANTASGLFSLSSNTTGDQNTSIGVWAGDTNAAGSRNTFLGADADAVAGDLTNATAVGHGAMVDASNHVRIGDGTVTQIGGQVAWSNLSDARHKSDVRDLDLGREFVMALRPVSFTVNGGDGRTDMGFLAQDVEALLGDGYNVVGIGADPDRTLSLRYTDLIAPLVKAAQEQQAQIAAQAQTIQSQQALIADLLTRVASLEKAAK